MITLTLALAVFQDTPVDIAKKDLPKAAECVVCNAQGGAHGLEKPAAGVTYKGKAYYFCNSKEVAGFKKTPDFFLPLTLPMPLKFDMPDLNGVQWNKQAFAGKLVLIDYWATWCGPCHALKPKIDKLAEANKGLTVLSVSIDEEKDALTKWVAKRPFANPVLWDDKQTWVDLRVVSIPALFLVKDGQVIAEYRGKVNVGKIEKDVKANL